MNNEIFLDASFWIAARDRKDPNCKMAHETLVRVAKSRAPLVTTLLVAAETHAYFSRSKMRLFILEELENNPAMKIEPVNDADQNTAISLLRQYSDKEFSLCDAVTFGVMERLEIKRALSLDHHFKQYGKFEVISRPEEV
jgi:predicted nucleic acid-binding protein